MPNLSEISNALELQVVARVNGVDVTRAALSQAFDRVADRSNWKNPIDAIVDIDDPYELALICEAVRFFAGCVAQTRYVGPAHNGPDCRKRMGVRAVGYYAAVGA